MILDQLANNVELAHFYVGVLRQLRALNPKANIDQVMEPLLKEGFGSLFIPAQATVPALWIGGNDGRRVCLIDGVSTPEQASGLISGYDNGTGPLTTIGFNPWMQNAATFVRSQIVNRFIRAPEHVDLIGYSAGGAIAIHVKNQFLNLQALYKTKVVTFGSPRPGSTAFRERLSGSSVVRWMNDNDPIPLIPPRLTDIPSLVMFQALRTSLRWGSFVQTGGGISIDAAGVCTPAVLPLLAVVNAGNSLASWFLGQENSPNNPHALTSYQGRLELAVLAARTPAALNKREGAPEIADDANRGHTTQRQREVMDLIANAGHSQNSASSVVPDVVLFQAVRVNRIWAVEFGGRIICWAPIRKRAQHIARVGNEFLRSLPKQAIVDPVALGDQFAAFLVAAADPAGAFSPPIRIGL